MSELSKKLETRHLNMIALGGSIGTGIFLASGYSISVGGPGGALFGYAIMGVIVYFLMMSLGEMSTQMPHTGTFCKYSRDFVSPSFGFAMSYNYWFNWAITIATEISAAVIIIQFWYPHASVSLLSAVFFVVIFIFNIFSVRVYGELEYVLSFIKVAVVIVFIIVGLLLIGEKPDIIPHNWSLGDAPFHGGFLGFLTVFLFAGFSFQGTELVGVASGETKDPQVSIPRSIRLVFWRLCLFYILATFVIGSLVSYTDPSLTNQSDVMMSPFTKIFSEAGLKYAGSIINLVILIAVVSAANASMYSATRILWYMAKSGETPKVFEKVDKRGVPILALLLTSAIGSLVFLSSFVGNGVFFSYIVQISSLSGFIAWFGIALSHYRFRKLYSQGGGNIEDLKFRAKFYPLGPIISMIVLLAVVVCQIESLVQSHTVTTSGIILTYSSVILFLVLWASHALYRKMVLHKLKP
jgi:lysine-specific permease